MLAQAIVREGAKSVAAGMNPMDLKRGIDLAVAAVVKDIEKRAKPVASSAEVAQVGTISANGDQTIGKMIAQAMQKVGNEGVITVEEAKSLDTEVEIVEGMQFDRGYLSPYFITNAEKMIAELEDAYILLHEKKLVRPAGDAAAARSRWCSPASPLLIIAEDVEGEALATLVVNQPARRPQGRGREGAGLRRSPQGHARGHRDPHRRPADLRRPRHQARERVTLDMLGRAKKVMIDKEKTTIVNGAGKKADIEARVCADQGADRGDHLRLRPARSCRSVWPSSPAALRSIQVGGATEIEVKEKKDRVEDALNATRAAVRGRHRSGRRHRAVARQEGRRPRSRTTTRTCQAGINIVLKALEAPLRQIAENAGVEGSIVVGKILENKSETFGFDAQNEEYVDMLEKGHRRSGQGRAHRAAGRGVRGGPARSPPKPWSRKCRAKRRRQCRAVAAAWVAWAEWAASKPSPTSPHKRKRRPPRPAVFVGRIQLRARPHYGRRHART